MSNTPTEKYDVVICGGGLAGLTLALQLRQTLPDVSVAVVEKSARPLPESAHKVGESSVELGSWYLEQLGLKEYLKEAHIFKFGLRFFPGGGELPIHQRPEIGPIFEPIVPSYQLDRGTFENDLRGFVEDAGATLLEGLSVREIALSDDDTPHRVMVAERDDTERELNARWVFDATGRAAHLRRAHKLTRGTGHTAHAGWYRVRGKVDITDMAPESATDWHGEEFARERWRSTNHLMGKGYWAWLIPLSSGNTSVGLVVHDDVHGFERVRSFDRMQAFLKEYEPHLAQHLEGQEQLDFGAVRNYSYNVAKAFSPSRWGLVGEAAAFVDPLYSPGTDYIGYSNSFATTLVKADMRGEDIRRRTKILNLQYRTLVSGNVDVYRDASEVYAHGDAMMLKLYWDNYAYWCFPCQYFIQGIYELEHADHVKFTLVGRRFVELAQYVQALAHELATRTESELSGGFHPMPGFPSVLVDAHVALQESLSADETYTYMSERAALAEHIVGELLIRVLFAVGDDAIDDVLTAVRAHRWELEIPEGRLAAENERGLARRKLVPDITRDVERSLGRMRRVSSVDAVSVALQPFVRDTAEPVEAS